MLTVYSELLKSIELHEDLILEKLSFSAGDSLFRVMRAAVGAKTRTGQAPAVLEAVMRTLEKQTVLLRLSPTPIPGTKIYCKCVERKVIHERNGKCKSTRSKCIFGKEGKELYMVICK